MVAMSMLRGTILALATCAVTGIAVGAPESHNNANDVVDYLETYRAGAQAGVREDQYNLGASYRWGVGIERNLILAVLWIRKSADQKYPLAERTIGEMYEKGEGLSASREEAMRWYRRAAEHGDADAQKDLTALEAKIHPVPPATDSP